ncbi:MAG: precorrin-6y C5,15-methyltransferase (decarboxylating) subunit CbiE [Candidatus Omnitrophota bacterium]|nr:precorrin-6y C5,15-methyltransferase (decarboxylating) subunit CbiE [Candidatus Omnitrophota bacterium]
MSKIYIIGVGPGIEDYLLPVAKKQIENSDCLISSRRILAMFKDCKKEEFVLDEHFDEVIPYVQAHKDEKKLAVLVSGDTGLYSLLEKLSKEFKKEEYEVIPGISTLQIAFSKIGESWQDAKIISLHGRPVNNLSEEIKAHFKVFLFTDADFPPQKIAEYLLKEGVENRRAVVLENLTYPNERIIDTDLVNLSKMRGFGLCVMIVKKI